MMPIAPGNVMEVVGWQLYDTDKITATTTELAFFANEQGSGTPGKTLLETNMKVGHKLQSPYAFVVQGVRFEFLQNVTLADAKLIMAGMYIVLQIGQKEYLTSPISQIPTGNGLYLAGSGAAATESITSGVPEYKNAYVINPPQPIEPNQWFGVTLFAPTAMAALSADTLVRVYLDGQLSRPTQ